MKNIFNLNVNSDNLLVLIHPCFSVSIVNFGETVEGSGLIVII